MTDRSRVVGVIREALTQAPLADDYADEQRDLQPYVQATIDAALSAVFGPAAARTTISVGGIGKPNLKLLGTSFWPDVEIIVAGTAVAAVEVKLIRSGRGASKAVAESIGQSVIYSIRYPHVLAFVAHYGRSDARCHEEDAALKKRLLAFNVELILRRVEPRGT